MKQKLIDIFQWLRPWLPFILALVPVMLFRDFTPRNELRYLTIADEALHDGHFWSFTFEGEPYADKPPFYLWLVMLSRWVFGCHVPLVICLFSLIPAMGILYIMDKWTRPVFSNTSDARLCQWIMATLGLQLGLAVFARMDMLMSLFIVGALYLYWQQRRGWLFGAMLFLALFSKGPFGILIPLVTTLVWAVVSRDWRTWLQMWSWRTWLILLVASSGWFAMVYHEGGADYLNNMLFHQTVDRAVEAFHHKRPWWFYLVHIWYTALPWGPLCLVGVGQWLYRTIRSKSVPLDMQSFFTIIFLATLIMLSCVSGKLDVYLLPAYPFLAYAGMLQMLHSSGFSLKWRNGLLRACHVLMWIIFIAGLALPFVKIV